MLQTYGTPDATWNYGAGEAMHLDLPDGPLDLDWQHCGRTSDFLAAFFSTALGGSERGATEARHNISYLVNELLENAVKFRSSGGVALESTVAADAFKLCVIHALDKASAAKFQEVLAGLEGRDPGELMIERIEQNAADPESTASGLGLLTLMGDYKVRLSWNFHWQEGSDSVRLETHAMLPLG